jgi:hypothetical protein
MDTLMRLGERLGAAFGRAVPLFYGNDDYLNLILRNRGRLAQHYRFILNDPPVAEALIDKERFDASRNAAARAAYRRVDDLAGMSGPVWSLKLKLAFEACRLLRLLGRAGKARVFASAQEAVCRSARARAARRASVSGVHPGDDRQIWSFHAMPTRTAACHRVHRAQDPHLPCPRMSTTCARAARRACRHRSPDRRAHLPKGVFKIDFAGPAHRRFDAEVNARFNLWHYRRGERQQRRGWPTTIGCMARCRRRPRPRRLIPLVSSPDYRAYWRPRSRGELTLWRWLAPLVASRGL